MPRKPLDDWRLQRLKSRMRTRPGKGVRKSTRYTLVDGRIEPDGYSAAEWERARAAREAAWERHQQRCRKLGLTPARWNL